LHGTALAAEDGHTFLAVEALKLNELGVLAVVVEGSDEHLHEEGDEDEDSLDPAGAWLNHHTGDDAENSEKGDEKKDAVVQGVLQRVEEGGTGRLGLRVHGVPKASLVRLKEAFEGSLVPLWRWSKLRNL